ncbi:TRAP transporter large permease, partial [Anaerotruncus rubiinfantis]
KRLINVAQSVVGGVTGGFGIVTVLACAFFAAISGSSPATVAAIGAIMIPAMVERGYSVPVAASITACSGGLGIIIPPSINMIIYAISANVSVADMFLAGFGPGAIIVLALCIMIFIIAKRRGYKGTGVKFSMKSFLSTVWDAKWALLAPVIILGGIYSGWFTPTESAAIAVVYGLVVGLFVYRELKFKDLGRIFVESATTTGAVVIILATATAFGRLVSMYQIPQMISSVLFGISQNWIVILLLISVLLLILGMFMETLSIMIILTPILLPLVKSMGVDPIHFGMIMVLGAQIGMITPPVGVNLFVASGISGLSLEKMSKGIIPFVLLMCGLFVLIILVPEISTFIPALF